MAEITKEKKKIFQVREVSKNPGTSGSVTSVFAFILAWLVFFSVFNVVVLQKPTIYTFSDFLTYCNAQELSIDSSWLVSVSNARITASWGWADFLRSFFNFFMDIVTSFLYFCQGLIQFLKYVAYTLGFFMGY